MTRVGLYINGAEVESVSAPTAAGATFVTRNPATGEVLAEVACAGAEDVDRAVVSAAAGFQEWSALTGAARGRILLRAAALLRERNDELARLEVLDTGKPIAEAEAVDVISGAECIEYFAGAAATIAGEHYDLGGSFAYTRREPLGVCAGIGAWNYPIQIACWKSAPALACGNAMVFKPSELTPLTAMKLAEIYTEAGVPAGVFNVVQGDRSTGEALVRHPGVAKVSLTGSVPTGKAVMAIAAQTLKAVTLELGGKSPLVIFEDADLDAAVSAALLANFYTQGEVCSNGTRVFVAGAVHDEFLDRLTARVATMTIGDPLDPKTDVGALISEAHLLKVLGFIEAGIAAGAARRVRRPSRDGDARARRRLVRGADGLRRVHGRHEHRAGGDLRPGHERARIRHGDRGGHPGQRHRLRLGRRGLHAGSGPRPPGRRRDRGRHRVDQHVQPDADRSALRRVEAIRPRPGEQPRGHRALHPTQDRLRRNWRRRLAVLTRISGARRPR